MLSIAATGENAALTNADGRDMRFWLALFALLLSLAVARAQVSQGPRLNELPELTPEQKANCISEVRRTIRRECDVHGCYFNSLSEVELTQQQELQCRLQKDLQRRADEARKKLEADRKNSN